MKNRKGFTLVEAAVAIAVVAILSGIIIPLVLKNVRDAREARARNDIMVIAGAIAHQLHDTGSRPRDNAANPGLNGTGRTDAFWYSGGQLPRVNGLPPAPVFPGAGAPGGQTFANLFDAAVANGRGIFGLPVPVAGTVREFDYKGPYLGLDMATKTDPWGGAYVILGYNANGQAANGPIWVVCAGERREINRTNLTQAVPPGAPLGAAAVYRSTWDYTLAGSETNIAVRVH